MTTTDTQRIAALNDAFRQTAFGGQWVVTRGIAALPTHDQLAIMRKVQTFDAFTVDNDPHGEHDFGNFTHAGERIFWKIDYYDRTLTFGSDDPADPAQTVRVMTVMLASEY
jgi:hypothetical protein